VWWRRRRHGVRSAITVGAGARIGANAVVTKDVVPGATMVGNPARSTLVEVKPETRDFVVVHGHTILDTPHVSPLRISLDTGAFASGQLTAIGLEGSARWLISVQGEPAAAAA
jgi:hypothetical protein